MTQTIWKPLWSRVSSISTCKSLVAAGLLAATSLQSAEAASILIDDFQTTQIVESTKSSPMNWGSVLAPEAIGGERDVYVDFISGATNLKLSVNPFGNEFLIHDSGALVQGYTQTVWDGKDGDPLAVDPTGLGGVDLTAGGNDRIRLSYVFADLAGTVSLKVWDASDATGDTWSQAIFNLPAGGITTPTDVDIPYTDFTTVGIGGPANFSNVGAIEMEIRNSANGSLDLQLSAIHAVPEPSAVVLSLLGIAGAFAPLRRFRRK